jgi:hypothetical protein
MTNVVYAVLRFLHYAGCCYTECHYTECPYAECHSAENKLFFLNGKITKYANENKIILKMLVGKKPYSAAAAAHLLITGFNCYIFSRE